MKSTRHPLLGVLISPEAYAWARKQVNLSETIRGALERKRDGPCPMCKGTGLAPAPVTVKNSAPLPVSKAKTRKDSPRVSIRLPPDLDEWVRARGEPNVSAFVQEVIDEVRADQCPACHGTGIKGGGTRLFKVWQPKPKQ